MFFNLFVFMVERDKQVREDAPEHIKRVKQTEICKHCKNIVVGKGNENADIMFIGEAPGRNEDLEGLPFVGRAGKNLDKLLQQVGLSLEDVYIANILKCRPPENRDPSPEEIREHTPWLIEQIKEIKPKVVCTLGNYATKFFLSDGKVEDMGKMPGITSVHGKSKQIEFHDLNIKLIPLFHPAALIYNRSIEPLWMEDMEIVKNVVEENRKQKTLS